MRSVYIKRSDGMYMEYEWTDVDGDWVNKRKLKMQVSDGGPILVRYVAKFVDILETIGVFHIQEKKHTPNQKKQVEYVRDRGWSVPKYLGGLTAGVARLE